MLHCAVEGVPEPLDPLWLRAWYADQTCKTLHISIGSRGSDAAGMWPSLLPLSEE